MRKYLEIGKAEWKTSLAYRVDTWLSAGFSIFSIALIYLLYKAIYRGGDTLGGMTLREMTSYYLYIGVMASLAQSDGITWEFSREIKTGQYAKYIIRPASPLYTFMVSGFAQSLFPFITNGFIS